MNRVPVVVAAALLAALAPTSAYASTWTVDDDKADCPNAAFTSIQAAVNQAAPWDTVVICAGVYEELVFRFLLLAGGFAFLHKGLGVPKGVSFAIALAVSSLLFAAYHHVGPAGEPLRAVNFGFRLAAGLLLGVVFAGRGLALCAYLHAFYDVFCDLRSPGEPT